MWSELLILTIFSLGTSADIYGDHKSLLDLIFKEYNPSIIPIEEPNIPLKVNVTMFLMSVIGLDEKYQIFKASIFWAFLWQDEMLKWKDKIFSNVTDIVIKTDNIWVPELFLVNSITDMRLRSYDQNDYVNVASDGLVRWYPVMELRTSCAVDLTVYPFDTQTCTVSLETWYHDRRYLILHASADGLARSPSHFMENGEWEILNITARPREALYVGKEVINYFYSNILFSVTLKRRSFYHVVTIVFPFAVFTFLNSISIVVPIECGEKLGFCTSNFLAMFVFLTLVAQNMPTSSFSIPYLTYLIGTQILVSGITTAVVGLSIYLRNRNASCSSSVCSVQHHHSSNFDLDDQIDQSTDQKVCFWPKPERALELVMQIVLILSLVVTFFFFVVLSQ